MKQNDEGGLAALGDLRQRHRFELNAEEIVAYIQAGAFETLTECMEDKIGIPDSDWERLDGSSCCDSLLGCCLKVSIIKKPYYLL